MNSSLMIVLAAALGFAVAAPVAARGPMGPMMDFDSMDIDKDGKLTPEETETYRTARFAAADSNGDGTLDRAELVAAAKADLTGRLDAMASAAADRMLDAADQNDDGKLARDEAPAQPGARMFRRLDRDGDGAVSKAELEAMRDRKPHHRRHDREASRNDMDQAPLKP